MEATLLLIFVLLFSGCSPAYVLKAGVGHMRMLAAKRPIERLLQDPRTPEGLKAGLRLSQEVRRFGVETMGLRTTRNYMSYVEVPRPYVALAVTACKKTSFEPYEWWFPVMGRIPYKCHFDPKSARREARRLEAKGYDTAIMEVEAYSTLGWTSDPVLSTMLGHGSGRLAEVLLHEMSHLAVYFKGQAEFNESAATFLGQEGSADFLRRRFGEDSPESREFSDSLRRERETVRAMEALYAELSRLYSSGASDEEKLLLREEVFSRARPGLPLAPGRTLNNALVLGIRRYYCELGDFQRLHEGLGRDWKKTLQALRSLDRRRPREALRERIGALTPPDGGATMPE